MNLVSAALRRPVTFVVLIVAIVLAGMLAVVRMQRDIFPDLGVPVLYVAQPYGGMDPAQMEGFITNYYEYHFLYINGIEHVESKNVQGIALIKLQFHPGTNMATAMAETVSYVNRARAFMPTGTVPPFVMRFDAGSVPVGNLVFSSDDPSLQLKDLQDAALFKVRPLFATLPGVSAPPPFGGSPRTIVVSVDPDRLRSYNMSPDEVVTAITKGNMISPSGNVRIGNAMPMVPINSVAQDVKQFEAVPIRSDGTRTVYVRDVGSVADAADTQVGYALVNGRRTVYIPVTKRADASTLSVVSLVKENLPRFQSVLPPGVKVSYEFDQSPYVTRAISGLGLEGLLGAVLTGLMVLLFLRDWRSALVVVLNIPLSVAAALLALWVSGQTVNVMTLGGLALAVGILVDEATVSIENIHTHLADGVPLMRAALDATNETTVPRLLAMLSILAVFIPAFFMQGAARNLFVPLATAVGFSMVASYLLSSTLVPILSVWVLRTKHDEHATRESAFDRFRKGYASFSSGVVRLRWLVVPMYLAVAGGVIYFVGRGLGREIFPIVDAGQFQLRLRAPAGTRLEQTEAITKKTLDVISKEAGDGNVAITLGYVGVQAGAYPVNVIHLWTSGSEEAVLQVQLKPGTVRVEELKQRLREKLASASPGVRFSFEPGDIVSRVMSFGSPTPVQVAVSGPDFKADREFAAKLQQSLAKVSSLRDLAMEQELDYPAVRVNFDRERGGALGVTAEQAGRSLAEATGSSRYTTANFWADPKSGVGYQVQVQVPIERMDSIEQVKNVPIATKDGQQLQLRQVADVSDATVLGQYDRYNMQRMLTLGANVEGEDLGRAAARVDQAIKDAGAPPPRVNVAVRGQVTPMRELFGGLANGLGVAVLVIFLLLAANFQSLRLSLAIILTVPAVVAGVAVALWVTRTTLNIQSFMGAIMAVGVAVANSILLVTFAERNRVGGMTVTRAASAGAASRLRPILMTSFAMIAGMMPMAIGLGEGGEQTAPLGRAVVGGLLGATLATLVVLPAIFALLQTDKTRKSASIHPDDQEQPEEIMQTSQRRQSKSLVGLLVAGALMLITSGARAQTPATAPAAPQAIAVTGAIEAFWSADLNAKTSGYVIDVRADLGDHVKKDALMAVLAVPELEKGLAQAKATVAAKKQMLRAADAVVAQSRQALAVAQKQLESYKIDLEYQQVTLKRQQELSAGSAITPQQLDEARSKAAVAAAGMGIGEAKVGAAQADIEAAQANRDVAAAQVDVAQAVVEEVETMIGYTRITAPFDGVVTRRLVNIGELVQGSATTRGMPLFTLQQVETVRVFCDVPELQAAGVAVGDRADVKIYGLDGQVITAKVTRMAAALNPTTRTMRAEIDLPNASETLRPGMYVQVSLSARPARAPTTAAVAK